MWKQRFYWKSHDSSDERHVRLIEFQDWIELSFYRDTNEVHDMDRFLQSCYIFPRYSTLSCMWTPADLMYTTWVITFGGFYFSRPAVLAHFTCRCCCFISIQCLDVFKYFCAIFILHSSLSTHSMLSVPLCLIPVVTSCILYIYWLS